MKRKLNFIISLIFILLCLCGCQKEEKKQDIKNENTDTIKPISFNCDDFKNNNIIYFDGEYMALDNNQIYETTLKEGKMFSNNQQCKKIEIDLEINDIKIFSYVPTSPVPRFVLSNNNNYYKYYVDTKKLVIVDTRTFYHQLFANYGGNKIFYSSYNDKTILGINVNGNLYKYTYENYPIQEEIIMSSQEYGKVLDVIFEDNLDFKIKNIITENGYYTLKENVIETDECMKYEDIECEIEYKFIKNKKYDKYKDNIKYVGNEIVVLKDNSILYLKDILK